MSGGCRIGKVTPHDGIALLKTEPRGLSPEIIAEMRGYFENILSNYEGDLGALIIIGIGMDVSHQRSTAYHKNFVLGPTIIPSYVEEILRNDKTALICNEVIDERVR